MEKIIMEILQALYTADIKRIKEAWLSLQKECLKKTTDKKNFYYDFQYFVLAQTLATCLKEDSENIKSKITICIKYMLKEADYKTELKDFINSYCSNREGNAKAEMESFKQLAQTGVCEDKSHYNFGLYYLMDFTYDIKDEACIFNIFPVLRAIVSFSAWFSQSTHILERHISDYVLGFYYEYCEQETLEKRYFYTDKSVIEERLIELQKRDPNKFAAIMKNHHYEEVYDWVHLYELFESNERSYTLLRLFEKVFMNKTVIIQSNKAENDEIDYLNNLMEGEKKFFHYYTDNAYESAPQLFEQARSNIKNIDNLPGICIMLYMLCKEFTLEQFYTVFPDRINSRMKSLEEYEWDLIPDVLESHDRNKGRDKNYDELFELYDKDLLQLYSNVAKDFAVIAGKKYKEYEDNNELLNKMLYFCVWENVSYCMKDLDNFHGDINEAHKTQLLINPFFEACEFDKWRDESTIGKIFNNIAEFFYFNDASQTFDNFYIDTKGSNRLLISLIYNLSRPEIEAQSAMKNQINYLREIQLRKLPLERNKSNLEESKNNQSIMQKIDKGFNLKDFITQVYPFCGVRFQNYFQDPSLFMLRRNFVCKFACETDTIFKADKETETDYRKTNLLGFKTRYLYKDRNMSTHHSRHASVDSLMKTSNWRNLLYAFCDAEKSLLELFEEKKREYYEHPGTSPKPNRNPQMFVIYYLLKENKRLYNEFIAKLYKTAGLIQECAEFKLYVFDEATGDFRDNSENIIKKIEATFNLTDDKTKKKENEEFARKLSYSPISLNCNAGDDWQKREDLFELRLERMLNIMFAVNGSNENGYEHNLTMYDFFKRYHAEIAFYLVYLTGEFSKL